jgi:hypothetical protein
MAANYMLNSMMMQKYQPQYLFVGKIAGSESGGAVMKSIGVT